MKEVITQLQRGDKPNLLCVKSYATIEMPPSELGARMWNWSRRGEWDLLLPNRHNPAVLKWMDEDNALVTHSRFDFPYPFHPFPVPPGELVMAHTRRTDPDGTIIMASASAECEAGLVLPQ
jgi:hypothetical protein